MLCACAVTFMHAIFHYNDILYCTEPSGAATNNKWNLKLSVYVCLGKYVLFDIWWGIRFSLFDIKKNKVCLLFKRYSVFSIFTMYLMVIRNYLHETAQTYVPAFQTRGNWCVFLRKVWKPKEPSKVDWIKSRKVDCHQKSIVLYHIRRNLC